MTCTAHAERCANGDCEGRKSELMQDKACRTTVVGGVMCIFHPFIPIRVIPWMKLLWAKKKRTMMGMTAYADLGIDSTHLHST